MKFTAAIFAIGALAAVRRQTGDLSSDIQAITTATEALGSAIEAYTGGVEGAIPVQNAVTDVVNAIAAAQTTADGIDSIDQASALGLVNPIQSLSTAVNETVTALIERRDLFEEAGLTSTVLDNLQTQQSASSQLTDTIIGKIPENLQETGRGLAQPAADALAAGIAAFSQPPSGGSSSAEPSATAPATSDAATSAPATSDAATTSEAATSAPATSGAATSAPAATGAPAPAPYPGAPSASAAPYPGAPSASASRPVGSGANATSTYTPAQYTGAAAQQVVGLGAIALGALVAVM